MPSSPRGGCSHCLEVRCVPSSCLEVTCVPLRGTPGVFCREGARWLFPWGRDTVCAGRITQGAFCARMIYPLTGYVQFRTFLPEGHVWWWTCPLVAGHGLWWPCPERNVRPCGTRPHCCWARPVAAAPREEHPAPDDPPCMTCPAPDVCPEGPSQTSGGGSLPSSLATGFRVRSPAWSFTRARPGEICFDLGLGGA